MLRTLPIGLIVLFSACLKAQTHGDPSLQIRQAIFLITSLQFDSAQLLLNEFPTDDPYRNYAENYQDFLRIFISEDQELFDRLEHLEKTRLNIIENMPEEFASRDYMRAIIQLQWALCRLKFSSYWTAAFEIYRAYHLLENNLEKHPQYLPNQLGMGLMKIMVGSIPPNYRWLSSLFSMSGSVEDGLEDMYFVMEATHQKPEWKYLFHETLFFSSFIRSGLEELAADDEIFTYFDQRDPKNTISTFAYANILMRSGQNEKAISILESVSDQEGFPFYYLRFMLGNAYLRKGDDRALDELSFYLDNFNGLTYLKDAQRMISWFFLLKGDSLQYLIEKKKILSTGFELVDADKQAQFEAEDNQIPNPDLLRARLLFDGGYYREALNILDRATLSSTEELLESVYRYGRVYHRMCMWEEAKQAYSATISYADKTKAYFPANAALKLGLIYEQEAKIDSAILCYEKCLDMNFEAYETSIKTKAKAQLNKINSAAAE